jgi:hypothetical protein
MRLVDSHNVSIVNTDDAKQQKNNHVYDYGLVVF